MSKEIKIPFAPDMKKAILEGRKTCTSRSERYGEIGDWFVLEGRKFEFIATTIDDVILKLEDIAWWLYRAEGFSSPEEFITRWKQLHRGRYNPYAYKFVHFFKEMEK